MFAVQHDRPKPLWPANRLELSNDKREATFRSVWMRVDDQTTPAAADDCGASHHSADRDTDLVEFDRATVESTCLGIDLEHKRSDDRDLECGREV